MRKTILRSDRSYVFADYFELNYPTEDIIAEFGYQYALTRLTLPVGQIDTHTERLKATFYKQLPHVSRQSPHTRDADWENPNTSTIEEDGLPRLLRNAISFPNCTQKPT